MKKSIKLRTEINFFISLFLIIVIFFQMVICFYCWDLLQKRKSALQESTMFTFESFVERNLELLDDIQRGFESKRLTDFITNTNVKQSYSLLCEDIYNVQKYTGNIVGVCAFDQQGNMLTISKNIGDTEKIEVTKSYQFYLERKVDGINAYYDVFSVPDNEYQDIYFICFAPIYMHDFSEARNVWVGDICVFTQKNATEVFYNYESIKSIRIKLYSGEKVIDCIDKGIDQNDFMDIQWSGQQIPKTMWTYDGEVVYSASEIPWKEFMFLFLTESMILMIVIIALNYHMKKHALIPLTDVKNYMTGLRISDKFVPIKVQGSEEIKELSEEINMMIVRNKELTNRIMINQRKLYDAENLKNEAIIYALQNQVNPHYIYNIFELIRSIAIVNGIDEIETVAVYVSDLLRYNLNKDYVVSVGEELEIAQKYIQVMQVKYSESFDVIYDVADDVMDKKIMRMIFQPVIENAFNHGYVRRTEKFCIKISAYCTNNTLYITFFDNGLGMNEEQLEAIRTKISAKGCGEGKQIGLTNLAHRLDMLYQERCELEISSKQNTYTCVSISIKM